MILAFGRGRGLVGALIRWFTWSKYAHVAVVTPEGVFEATPFKGIIQRDFWEDTEGLDFFVVTGAYEPRRVLHFLKTSVGRPYDWGGVARFLPRWRKENDRLFCSEYAFLAFRFGGIELLRAHPKKVSPGMLATSPFLHELPTVPLGYGEPPVKL